MSDRAAPVDPGFVFGRPKLHELGFTCCGKPQGCTNPTDGCAYKQHPYKKWVRGEITLEELNSQVSHHGAGTTNTVG